MVGEIALCLLACASLVISLLAYRQVLSDTREDTAQKVAIASFIQEVRYGSGSLETRYSALMSDLKSVKLQLEDLRRVSELDTGYYNEVVDKQTGKRSFQKMSELSDEFWAGADSTGDVLKKAQDYLAAAKGA